MSATGREPPADLAAERGVLGAILLSGGRVLGVLAESGLAADDFFHPGHRLVFAAVAALEAEGSAIDPLTVGAELRQREHLRRLDGGPAFLDALCDDVPNTEHVAHYAEIIRQQARLRGLIARGSALVAEAYTTEDPDALIESAESRIAEADAASAKSAPVKLGEVLKASVGAMLARRQTGDSLAGVTTGFPAMDAIMGGMEPGDVILIAGRPSQGKSALGFQMLLNGAIISDVPGLLFSLEMPAIQLGDRALALESRVDLTRIRASVLNATETSDYTRAAGKLAGLPVWIDAGTSANIGEIRARSRRWFAQHAGTGKVKGIIGVDYAQLVGAMAGARGRSRESEVAEVSRGMKGIATSLGVVVLLLAQVNRDCEKREDKRPGLPDLRESGSLEMDANKVAFIYRDEFYRKDKSDKPGIAEIIWAKNRNGQTGTVELAWNGSATRFDSLSYREE